MQCNALQCNAMQCNVMQYNTIQYNKIQYNDFSNASELLFLILFSDDTSVFIEGYEYDKMIEILNKKLKKVGTWLECTGLVINTGKTHYMVFHRAKFKIY